MTIGRERERGVGERLNSGKKRHKREKVREKGERERLIERERERW